MPIKKLKFRVFIYFAVSLLFISAIFFLILFIIGSKNYLSNTAAIEVEKGDTVSDFFNDLKNADVVKNSIYLEYLWRLKNKPTVKEGIYYIYPQDSLDSILKKVVDGRVAEKKITVVDGWRKEQTARYLASKKLVTYESFMLAADGLEGKLFPDTYRVKARPTAEEIVAKLKRNFDVKTKGLGLSERQLIVASLVEREAKLDEDRRDIAGVIYNRLKKGMPLEMDSSVLYSRDSNFLVAKDFQQIMEYDFWGQLGRGMTKKIFSPYNTYLHKGLPPGPICSPGLKSILASVNPADNDYYYFVHDSSGKAHFAKSLREHRANIFKYLQ